MSHREELPLTDFTALKGLGSVYLTVLSNLDAQVLHIDLRKLEVICVEDGKDYTSVEVFRSQEFSPMLEHATIIVRRERDFKIWRSEVDKLRLEYARARKEMLSPRHILPN